MNKEIQDSFHRMPDLCKRTGLARSSLYNLIKNGDFPKPIKLTKRTSVWSCQEVSEWIESKKAEAES